MVQEKGDIYSGKNDRKAEKDKTVLVINCFFEHEQRLTNVA